MKKIFMFAAMASVALASCVKNEPVATVEQGDLITFNSPVVAPATKAQVKYESGPFKVYAYLSDGSDYITNATVSLTEGVWSAGKYYWPKNETLDFCAYAPANTTAAPTATNTQLQLAYTVPEGAAEDLLYSEWAKDQTSATATANSLSAALGEYTGVDIAFHHALAQVNFIIVGSDDAVADPNVKINSINLVGLKNVGTLTVPATPEVDAPLASWNVTSGEPTYEVWENQAALAASSDPVTFILLPQSLEAAKLQVSYQLPSDADGGHTVFNIEVPLNGAKNSLNQETIGTWVMGTSYTYTIEFDVDGIQFAPVVEEDWATVTANLLEQKL